MNNNPDILARDAVNDPAAFIQLYDQYFSRVYNYIRYRCADPDAADDLTAQVFERLLKQIGRYSADRGSFEPWLFSLVRNQVADNFRRQKMPVVSWENLPEQPAVDPEPETQVIGRETEAELFEAVNKLDERARDLLGLKFAARLSNKEIARLTQLSESNVGVILFRALTQLRGVLQEKSTVWSSRRS